MKHSVSCAVGVRTGAVGPMTLDRMAPDGHWYSSTDSAEAEEPIGLVVESDRTAKGNVMWKAYYKGQEIKAKFMFDGGARQAVDEAHRDDIDARMRRYINKCQIDQLNAIAEGPFATVPL